MNYFFFDARALTLHGETNEAGILISDESERVVATWCFSEIDIKKRFAKIFNLYKDNSVLVTDRPFPMKTNFLNSLIDDELIENIPYLILDINSILYGQLIYGKTHLPQKDIMYELELMRRKFFSFKGGLR